MQHQEISYNPSNLVSLLGDSTEFRGYVRKRAHTRKVIIEAARSQLWEKGYEKFTMFRLANDSGVVPATLYRYYPNKEQVVDGVARDGFQRIARTSIEEAKKFGGTPDIIFSFINQAMLYSLHHCAWSREMLTFHKIVKRRIKSGIQGEFFLNLLIEGNKLGIFDIGDPETMAPKIRATFVGNLLAVSDDNLTEKFGLELQEFMMRSMGTPLRMQDRCLKKIPESVQDAVKSQYPNKSFI